MSDKVLQQLTAYDWPGNIRELEHVIERNAILCKGDTLKELYLSKSLLQTKPTTTFTLQTWEEHEKEYILFVLSKCNGRISGEKGAAQILNIPPTTLESRMKKLGIKKQHYRSSDD